jgi:hypothetical protein
MTCMERNAAVPRRMRRSDFSRRNARSGAEPESGWGVYPSARMASTMSAILATAGSQAERALPAAQLTRTERTPGRLPTYRSISQPQEAHRMPETGNSAVASPPSTRTRCANASGGTAYASGGPGVHPSRRE